MSAPFHYPTYTLNLTLTPLNLTNSSGGDHGNESTHANVTHALENVREITLTTFMVAETVNFLVNYVLVGVLWSLILVEATQQDAPAQAHSKKHEDDPSTPFAADFKLHALADETHRPRVRQSLTASVRKTLQYLYFVGGALAPFRALHVYVLYAGAEFALGLLADAVVGRGQDRSPVASALVALGIGAATAPLAVWWTHAVLCRPALPARGGPPRALRSLAALLSLPGLLALARQLRWPARPARAAVAAALPPTVLAVALRQFKRFRPAALPVARFLVGPLTERRALGGGLPRVGLRLGAVAEVVVVDATLYFCRHAPLLALRRVHASLLPADADTLVLMDPALREDVTAGGKGGLRHVRALWRAWTTIGWAVLWRLLKARAIAFVLTTVWSAACWTLIPALFGLHQNQEQTKQL